VRIRVRTASASGPSPISRVADGWARRAAPARRAGCEEPGRAVGRLELEGHRTGQRAAGGPERVREGAPGEPGDVPEPDAGRQLDAQSVRDVARVDPRLGQTCGHERPRRQLTGDPRHPRVQVHAVEEVGEPPGAVVVAPEDLGRRPAALVGDHRRGTVVDRGRRRETDRQVAHRVGEPAGRAADRHLVRLRQVEHDVGDVPALAPARRVPAPVVEPAEETAQLVLLVDQSRDDSVHTGERTRRLSGAKMSRMATPYDSEPVDRLPFGSPEKATRYATERYVGATGLNWWRCDPTLQLLMRYHHTADEMAWAEPHLDRMGALMGGPVSERAELTDRNPPRLERYDRWGHDISEVVLPPTFLDTRRDVLANSFSTPSIREDAARHGVRLHMLHAAHSYLLDQAEIGMACALGTGGDMVVSLVRSFAPPDIRERVLAKFASGEWAGETIQSLTERTGGSDLAELETTATRDGDAWRINGFKWFASNANGQAWVVLAKPEGAADGIRGIATFLVLRERRDGSRNGVRIRRLKDKLGTKAVASGEVELVDAEAFLLSSDGGGEGSASVGDGKGLTRMMEMTNGSRLGIAMMGLGCARRSLVEAMCYARARTAFGKSLTEHPLMQRKIAELIVEVEAAQAIVFDGYDPTKRLRIGAPLIKLRAARLGITAATDAIEVHGGNGYVENWPVARILRDAQVNTLWEGPDNILCLDVRRGIEREQADVAFLDRLGEALAKAPAGDPTTSLVEQRVDDVATAIERWKALDRTTAEARLYPLCQLMVDVYSAAILLEQAGHEERELGSNRKSLVARLFVRSHLTDHGPLRGIDDPTSEDLERFKDLWDGALVDDRVS
jgi:alkylation response protein AidB-like acyl-CoA dehydrogenase